MGWPSSASPALAVKVPGQAWLRRGAVVVAGSGAGTGFRAHVRWGGRIAKSPRTMRSYAV